LPKPLKRFFEIFDPVLKKPCSAAKVVTLVLATIGYQAEKVTHAIRHEGDVRAVTAVFGPPENRRVQKAVADVRETCRLVDLAFAESPVPSAYDFVAATHASRAETRRALEGGETVVVNMSGGTGILQSAAAFVAFTEGLQMSYYNVEEKRYVRMPRVRLAPKVAVTPQQEKVLAVLFASREGLAPGELARRTGLKGPNLDYHIGRLSASGLVDRQIQPGARSKVVATEAAMLLFAPPPASPVSLAMLSRP
jgi:DNA-binding transcriptional ArsR family regulator